MICAVNIKQGGTTLTPPPPGFISDFTTLNLPLQFCATLNILTLMGSGFRAGRGLWAQRPAQIPSYQGDVERTHPMCNPGLTLSLLGLFI